jgi:hypothetical protein
LNLPSLERKQDTDRGTLVALLFALVAQRLAVFYEHGQWPTPAQSASSAAEWLARSRRKLAVETRQQLAQLACTLAGQIQASVGREAGLFIAHELNEALDPNYRSEVAESIIKECERLIREELEHAAG